MTVASSCHDQTLSFRFFQPRIQIFIVVVMSGVKVSLHAIQICRILNLTWFPERMCLNQHAAIFLTDLIQFLLAASTQIHMFPDKFLRRTVYQKILRSAVQADFHPQDHRKSYPFTFFLRKLVTAHICLPLLLRRCPEDMQRHLVKMIRNHDSVIPRIFITIHQIFCRNHRTLADFTVMCMHL